MVELVVHVADVLHASVRVQLNATVAPAVLSDDDLRDLSAGEITGSYNMSGDLK